MVASDLEALGTGDRTLVDHHAEELHVSDKHLELADLDGSLLREVGDPRGTDLLTVTVAHRDALHAVACAVGVGDELGGVRAELPCPHGISARPQQLVE